MHLSLWALSDIWNCKKKCDVVAKIKIYLSVEQKCLEVGPQLIYNKGCNTELWVRKVFSNDVGLTGYLGEKNQF